jgi:hypothetical protein
MTPNSPDEAIHFRGKTLTPESPRPLHIPEPSNIPVLENQMDPVFNDTSTYEKPASNEQHSQLNSDNAIYKSIDDSQNRIEEASRGLASAEGSPHSFQLPLPKSTLPTNEFSCIVEDVSAIVIGSQLELRFQSEMSIRIL